MLPFCIAHTIAVWKYIGTHVLVLMGLMTILKRCILIYGLYLGNQNLPERILKAIRVAWNEYNSY